MVKIMNRFIEISEYILYILAMIVIILAIVFLINMMIYLHIETKKTNDYYNCLVSSKYSSNCKR